MAMTKYLPRPRQCTVSGGLALSRIRSHLLHSFAACPISTPASIMAACMVLS